MSFSDEFLGQTREIAERLDRPAIERAAALLAQVRQRGGRLFLIGSGGGAGHASHAACDFRKLCDFEAYCPSDNVSELTARINDEGWDSSLAQYLRGSRLGSEDCLLVFSVGGGSEAQRVSMNLVQAVRLAQERGAKVIGIVGRDGGYVAQAADACVIVPTVVPAMVTPHTEGFQAVIWHLLVSHPQLQTQTAKWEGLTK